MKKIVLCVEVQYFKACLWNKICHRVMVNFDVLRYCLQKRSLLLLSDYVSLFLWMLSNIEIFSSSSHLMNVGALSVSLTY